MLQVLRLRVALVLLAAGLIVPAVARADDGPDTDARVTGRCTGGAVAELRVRSREEGPLRVEITLRSRRPARSWTVVVVHERRLAFRGRLGAGRETLRLTVADLPGRDSVVVRATAAARETCTAATAVFGR